MGRSVLRLLSKLTKKQYAHIAQMDRATAF